MKKMLAVLVAAFCFSGPAMAEDPPKRWTPSAKQQEVMTSETFLSNHPDMLNRLRAMEALERGQPDQAAGYFRKAAHFADKQSQAAYAEMLWEGRGVPQDRPLAYAWMDLASERGFKVFLGFRERYWNALDEAERARAVAVGEEVYAEYGDAVAKPRMERVLRRAKRYMTGSRVGFVGAKRVIIPGPGGGIEIGGDQFYEKRFWEPRQYWHWQDEIVEGMRDGKVIVGDLKTREAERERKERDKDD